MSRARWLVLFILALMLAVPTYAVELNLGGFPSYMRTRARFLKNATFVNSLTDENAQALGFNNADDNIFFVDTTLRLTPQLVLSDAVTIRTQFDVFSNNLWGGSTTGLLGGRNTVVNSSISFSDRFRGALLTGPNAIDDPGFFTVRMLHADIVLPSNLGFLRVGRQPFDWGLGILANGGWDPYSDLGFVLDRFLYLKSFAVGTGSLTFVFVSDRFTQGNSLVVGSGDGYDGGAGALIYNNPNVGGTNLTIGGYIFPYIHQNNFGSVPGSGIGGITPPNAAAATSGLTLDRLTLYSGLIDIKANAWRLVGEIQGSWGTIGVDGADDLDIDSTNIIWAARAEVYPGWPVKMIAGEFGWAKGDDLDTASLEGGVIFFNPAYNLDQLLFKHMIPNIYGVESSVYNAFYGRVWGTVKLADTLSFTPQVVVAFNEETSNPYPGVESLDRYMGTEVEGTFTWHMHPGVNLDLIGSVVFAGDSLQQLLEQQAANTLAANDLSQDGFDAEKTPFAIQGRLLIFIDQFFK